PQPWRRMRCSVFAHQESLPIPIIRLLGQMEPDKYVIVGNGITGVTAAEVLRSENATAKITIIADDPFPVYYRPALKDYLAGRVREDKLWARPARFYQDQRIRFLPERVVSIQAG